MDEKTRKGFFECLCNFMSGHGGLTQEDIINELKDCGFAVRSFVKPQTSVTMDTDGFEIRTLSDLKKGDFFLDRKGTEWIVIEHKRSLTHVKKAHSPAARDVFVKNMDVRLPKVSLKEAW